MVSSSSLTGWLTPSDRKGTLGRAREQQGPWMSSIISCPQVYPAPGTSRVCEGSFTYSFFGFFLTLHCLRPMTVKTCCVNLVFMRRKPIRSRGLTSKLTDERVLEAAAKGCVQSFCQSEQIHPGLPSPQPTDASLGSRNDHASFSQRFPSRCASRLSFFSVIISDSPEHRAVGGSFGVKLSSVEITVLPCVMYQLL